MGNEYYGAPTTPNDDYLAHYGVKGMKWGVRRAVERGNGRALARQYKKAAKKLAKLEKRAASGRNYARRAAALGAGAAGMGAIAATGTQGVSKAIGAGGKAFSKGAAGVGGLMTRVGGAMTNRGIRGGGRLSAAGNAVSGLSKHNASGVAQRVSDWGKSKSIGEGISGAVDRHNAYIVQQLNKGNVNPAINMARTNSVLSKTTGKTVRDIGNKAKTISNSGYARMGAAALGAGLAAGAGYNAYRAATTKRAARKADAWRNEMNRAFAGTQYGGGQRVTRKKKRR